MLALRYAALVALVVWVGGLLVLGGIAAPALFDTLAEAQAGDGRALAGVAFGEMFRRFHLLSYACGAVIIGVLIARAVLGPRPSWFAVRVGIAAVMLAASAYSGMVVSARIARTRAEIGVAPSSLPETDPRRIAFGRMHATSTILQLVPILGGLGLLFIEMKESS
jgi:uncharacterized membrane protein